MNKVVTGGQLKKTREDLTKLPRNNLRCEQKKLIKGGGMRVERGQNMLGRSCKEFVLHTSIKSKVSLSGKVGMELTFR